MFSSGFLSALKQVTQGRPKVPFDKIVKLGHKSKECLIKGMFEVLSILISHKLCISYCNTCDLFKWLCLTCFADGDENGGEGPGEEQQGPQKPKKVLTLTIMCNLTGQENNLEIHLPSRPVNFIFHFPPLK